MSLPTWLIDRLRSVEDEVCLEWLHGLTGELRDYLHNDVLQLDRSEFPPPHRCTACRIEEVAAVIAELHNKVDHALQARLGGS